jgi:hypothetical protein
MKKMKRRELISIELTADEGMILTDGEHFAKAVLLSFDADESMWREIPATEEENEPNPID